MTDSDHNDPFGPPESAKSSANWPADDNGAPVSDRAVDDLLALLPLWPAEESAQDWFTRVRRDVFREDEAGLENTLASLRQTPALMAGFTVEAVQLAASSGDHDVPLPRDRFLDRDGYIAVHMRSENETIEIRVQAAPYVLEDLAGQTYRLLATGGEKTVTVPMVFDQEGEGRCLLPDDPYIRKALQRFRLVPASTG